MCERDHNSVCCLSRRLLLGQHLSHSSGTHTEDRCCRSCTSASCSARRASFWTRRLRSSSTPSRASSMSLRAFLTCTWHHAESSVKAKYGYWPDVFARHACSHSGKPLVKHCARSWDKGNGFQGYVSNKPSFILSQLAACPHTCRWTRDIALKLLRS